MMKLDRPWSHAKVLGRKPHAKDGSQQAQRSRAAESKCFAQSLLSPLCKVTLKSLS